MFSFDKASLGHPGQAVFESLSLGIGAGEIVALLGPSGAGKSTLLEALRQQQEHQVAWCPQAGSLVPMLSVFHNIYMGALARHSTLYNLRTLLLPSAAEKHAVGELAQALGLEDKLFTSVDRLSGGQAQRVALGRALYTRRPVLLADEPVSSLDGSRALQIILQLVLRAIPVVTVLLYCRLSTKLLRVTQMV